MGECVRIALLGAGIFAREAHYQAFQPLVKQGLVHVVACWSRSLTSSTELSKLYGVENKAPEALAGDEALEQLLGRDDVHAVVIALPIFVQAQYAIRALKAGKHEKPIAGSTEDARKVIKAHRELTTKRLYCVGENYRFEAALKYAADEVKSCGDLLTVEASAFVPFEQNSKYERTEWRRESKHAGGVLLDSAVHFIAGLRKVVDDDITALSSHKRLMSGHLPQVDTFSAILQYRRGCVGTINATYAAASRRLEINVCCTKANIAIQRGVSEEGQNGYKVATIMNNTVIKEQFLPFTGVDEEIRAFVEMCRAAPHVELEDSNLLAFQQALSAEEAFQDLAVIEAIVQGEDALRQVSQIDD